MVDLLQKQGLLGFSIAEACRESGLGRTTIYQAIANGDLVARKYGRRTVVLRDDLANFLQNLPSIVPANLNRRGDQ